MFSKPTTHRSVVVLLIALLMVGLVGTGTTHAQDDGQPVRAMLGVRFESRADGALVDDVLPDSPAAEAGIAPGDLIVAVNDEPVNAEHPLLDRLLAREGDEVVALTVQREDETLTLPVRLAALDEKSLSVLPGRDLESWLANTAALRSWLAELRGQLGAAAPEERHGGGWFGQLHPFNLNAWLAAHPDRQLQPQLELNLWQQVQKALRSLGEYLYQLYQQAESTQQTM